MRIHLIKEKTIRNYVLDNAGSYIPLLGKGCLRVVFNIGGNNYRLICKYAFGEAEVHLFVCWIGTHAEYDKICGAKEQYSINVY